jgi:hypothetical protein
MKIKLPFYMYLANLCTKIVERENLSDPIPKTVGLISAGISSVFDSPHAVTALCGHTLRVIAEVDGK